MLIKKIYSCIPILLSLIIVGINLFYMGVHTSLAYKKSKSVPYYEPGAQFYDFRDQLKGVKKMGYLTNKDLSPEKNDGNFLQAQYIFAPTILDLNNSNYRFNLLDYSNQIYVFYKIKELNPIRYVDNEYGLVLAESEIK